MAIFQGADKDKKKDKRQDKKLSRSSAGKKKNKKEKKEKNPRTRRVWIFIVFYLLSLLILGGGHLSRSESVTLAAPSPTRIVASSPVSYESDLLTKEAVESAVANISPVMTVDEGALASIDQAISDLFRQVEEKKADYQAGLEGLTEKEEEKRLLDLDLLSMSLSEKADVLSMDPVDLDMVEEYSRSLIRKYMKAGVQSSGLPIARQNMLEEVMNSTLSGPAKTLIVAAIEAVELKETLKYDDAATSQRREDIVADIDPVPVNIARGEVLVEEGEIISPLIYEKIKHSDTSVRNESYLGLLGIAILLLVLYGIILWFLYQYRPELPKEESYLQLLAVLILFGLLASEIFARISYSSGSDLLFFYMTPLAAVGMLTTILLDNETGLMVSTVLSLLLGLTAKMSFEYTAVAMLASFIGVFSVAKLGHRGDLMKSAIYIAGVNILTILSVGWFLNYTGTMLFWALVMGLVGAFLSSVLAIGTLPYFEMAFKITTPVRLLEFSDPNQPLLKRLLMEAPGTYHHSIMVSNLSEAAAEAVGADRLLARVGAFYHDIGKLKRPYFFIENQQGMEENPHDKLSPRLSTLVITSHVKDGLDMAEEYKLPSSIRQFIATHHGDSMVRYFYNKAKELEGENIKESEFHYDGKKPVSKEAAIVMLADTVEASVRSLKNPNPGRVEGFVRKVIRDKFDEGQLSESKLTFRELETIAKAFIRILSGIYHQRVEYPETLAKEVQRRENQGESNHHEPTK